MWRGGGLEARNMASLSMAFAAPAAVSGTVSQATAATKTKTTGGSSEEKGLLDWILGGLQKQDQLLETDPILKKVDEKNEGGGTGTTRRKSPNSISLPSGKKSNGGGGGGVFGGLFAKK